MPSVDWLAFAPAAVGISLIPGASQLLGMRNAYRFGARAALTAVAGRLAAFAVMVAAVSVGLGALLLRSEVAFTVVKWCGAAYLVFLGLQSWWASYRSPPSDGVAEVVRGPARTATWQLTRQEFLIAAANPKAVFLFAALLPQFVRSSGSATAGLLLAGAAYLCVEGAVALLYCFVGASLRLAGMTARWDRIVQRVTGGFLVAFGVSLALSSRPSHT